jgi:tRNA U34 5-carboxymethylaminomethyl modifying GTPase MnmE/TrmE
VPPAFASTHLAAAAGSLEELIGAITPDDVLGRVFGDFCVGK